MRPPSENTVTPTEPPTKDSTIVAKDPCGNMVESVSVSNNDIIAVISPEATDPETEPAEGSEDEADAVAASTDETDHESFPFVPVVLGGVALVAMGAVGRRFGSR